jgi:hemin uptake protein HemP
MNNSADPPENGTTPLAPSGEPDRSSEEGAPTPRIPSRELFGRRRRIIIEHSGREYSLIITKQGKLILNRC